MAAQASKTNSVTSLCLAAVATATIGATDSCPEFRVAMVMSMMSSSIKYPGPGNERTLFSVSDIKKVTSGQRDLTTHIMAASEIMIKELLEDLGIATPLTTWALHIFMIRLVHHVMCKQDESRRSFANLDAVGNENIDHLVQISGRFIQSPWAKPSPAQSSGAGGDSVSRSHHGFVSFKGDGEVNNVPDVLSGMGFKRGAMVKNKKSGEKFKIEGIGDADSPKGFGDAGYPAARDAVTLIDVLQGKITVHHHALWNADYVLAQADEIEKVLQKYNTSYDPTLHFAV